MDTIFAIKAGDAICARGNRLSRAELDAQFGAAAFAEVGKGEGDVISRTRRRLDFATEQEGVLL